MPSKDLEKQILFKVYREDLFRLVDTTESPDFICTMKNGATFGVEVTELYRSESTARLHKIPNYVTQLLADRGYRHKDDRVGLRVEKVRYLPGGQGPGKEIDAIISTVLTSEEIGHLIGKVIICKHDKVHEYLKQASECDLIIHDPARDVQKDSRNEFISNLPTNPLAEVVSHSPFREIFLVVTESGAKEVYLPLKANLFLARVLVFEGHFRQFYRGKPDCLTFKNYFKMLLDYLCRNGFENVTISESPPNNYLNVGNISLHYDEHQMKCISEFIYLSTSTSVSISQTALRKAIPSEFQMHISCPDNALIANPNLVFEVNKLKGIAPNDLPVS